MCVFSFCVNAVLKSFWQLAIQSSFQFLNFFRHFGLHCNLHLFYKHCPESLNASASSCCGGFGAFILRFAEVATDTVSKVVSVIGSESSDTRISLKGCKSLLKTK